jgi:hypothetical protein
VVEEQTRELVVACLRRDAFEVLSRHVESTACVLLADVHQEDFPAADTQGAEILDDDAPSS